MTHRIALSIYEFSKMSRFCLSMATSTQGPRHGGTWVVDTYCIDTPEDVYRTCSRVDV